MHQLPSKLFLSILSTVNLIIPGNILVQRPQQDHGNHPGQEQDYDQAVEDGEPLDVGVGHGVEDVVPSAGPFNFILSPD